MVERRSRPNDVSETPVEDLSDVGASYEERIRGRWIDEERRRMRRGEKKKKKEEERRRRRKKKKKLTRTFQTSAPWSR